MISCIAIDDEPIALEVLKTHAAKMPFLLLKETFLSPVKALHFLQQTPVDLVLLDINMPDISGIELAKIITGKTKVVFTTAYADYAIQGFELAVVDYLLKPVSFDRFLQACNRVQEQLYSSTLPDKEKSFFVKDGYEWIKVSLQNLLYIEASDNYIIFQEKDKKTITRMTLGEAEERLPPDVFVKVHKSFIVNFSKIDKVEKHQVTITGKSIPLSTTFQKTLFDKLK